MRRKSLIAVAVLGLLLGGCGAVKPPDPPTKVFVAWDDSGFSRFVRSYETEVVEAVQKLAAEHDEVLGVVMDGQPLTTADISRQYFSPTGPEEDAEERSESLATMAAEFAKKLIHVQPETVAGSGQLQALELAAGIPGVSKILMWTDAIVNEPANHFNLTNASQSEIEAEIRHWQPRLRALNGKQVELIGVGHGVHSVATVERAKRLFKAIVPTATLTISLAGR
jgi:hypothetical protein